MCGSVFEHMLCMRLMVQQFQSWSCAALRLLMLMRLTRRGPQHLLKRTAMAVVRSPVDRDTIILHGGCGPTPDNPDNVYSSQLVALDTKRSVPAVMVACVRMQGQPHTCLSAGYLIAHVSRLVVLRLMLWALSWCRLTVKLLTPRGGGVPSGRAYHSMAALGSNLVVYGGKADTVLAPVPLAVFDYPKRRWSYPGTSPHQPAMLYTGCAVQQCQ